MNISPQTIEADVDRDKLRNIWIPDEDEHLHIPQAEPIKHTQTLQACHNKTIFINKKKESLTWYFKNSPNTILLTNTEKYILSKNYFHE